MESRQPHKGQWLLGTSPPPRILGIGSCKKSSQPITGRALGLGQTMWLNSVWLLLKTFLNRFPANSGPGPDHEVADKGKNRWRSCGSFHELYDSCRVDTLGHLSHILSSHHPFLMSVLCRELNIPWGRGLTMMGMELRYWNWTVSRSKVYDMMLLWSTVKAVAE